MRLVLILVLGAIFGGGLYLSGMTDPRKVLGFLDVAGIWDPSLAFVMGGAILVALPAFRLAGVRRKSFLGHSISGPSTRRVDIPLIAGSTIFGVGWGLSGVCPGPAVFNLGLFDPYSLLFFAAMVAGMALQRAPSFLLTLLGPSVVEQDGGSGSAKRNPLFRSRDGGAARSQL